LAKPSKHTFVDTSLMAAAYKEQVDAPTKKEYRVVKV
jgi:hypothetical protein